jgi:hypothetical protein
MPRARLARSDALVAAGALAVAASVALAACAPASAPQTAPTASTPDGLSVSIKQGRLDVVGGRLVVRFENGGDAGVTVDGFAVETPTLDDGLVRTEPFELGAGDAIDIRLDLPASRCGAEPGPVLVTLDWRPTRAADAPTDPGSASGTLTADDPFDTVARVTAADCLAESVADVAAIVMPEHLRSTGAGADRRAFVDVVVEPAASGDATMRIERVFGTTLLNAEDGIDWTLGVDVAVGDPPTTLILPVRPARCDAHAIADDKRGTILPFEITTSDGRAGRLDVPANDGLKAELYAYYGERCGLG